MNQSFQMGTRLAKFVILAGLSTSLLCNVASGPSFANGGGGGGGAGGGGAGGGGAGGGGAGGGGSSGGGSSGGGSSGGGSSGGGAGGGSAGGGSAGGSAGGGGGNGSGIYRSFSPDVCPTGYVLDHRRRVCVRAHAGVLPDEDLYQQGRALALAGFYDEAIPILEAISHTDDSMAYTMRGYATRKRGSFAAGMKLYEEALAIDPNNINTHEYIGEGYVSVGRVDLARVELAKLETLCGKGCEQYEDLEQAIDTGKVE
jgi:hypothetical protein